jgi:hypothetical protein
MEDSLNSTNITDNSPKLNEINDKEKMKKETNKECMEYISKENLKIISSIAINLEEIINDNYMNYRNLIIEQDNFFTNFLPCISIENYLKRLFYYTKIDISTLILAIIYIDNFCEKNGYILTLNNIYRIIMTSCLLSIKFNEDIIFGNSFYAKVGNFSVELLNTLEYEFYVKLNFQLLVNDDYYHKYFNYLSRNY